MPAPVIILDGILDTVIFKFIVGITIALSILAFTVGITIILSSPIAVFGKILEVKRIEKRFKDNKYFAYHSYLAFLLLILLVIHFIAVVWID